MKLYKVLVLNLFTTSKTEFDVKYKKPFMQVTLRVIEWLRILGNNEILAKSQNCMRTHSKLSCRNIFLALLLKKYEKAGNKVFRCWIS